jgi:hypothetical protein
VHFDAMEPDEFLEAVWDSHNFEINIVRLLGSGDISIVNKLLESFNKFQPFGSEVTLCAAFFDALASILIKVDDRKWMYLIAKNQDREIDHGISRLINSFLCSRKEKENIICNVLELLCNLTEQLDDINNRQSILDVPNKALVQVLSEENVNDKIINYSITFLAAVASYDSGRDAEVESMTEESYQIVRVDLVRFGIREVLMPIFTSTNLGLIEVLNIIDFINQYPENIP